VTRHAFIPSSHGLRLPTHATTVSSLNWSGYADTPAGGHVTSVTGNWIVPAAGLLPPGFAASWTGIGGFNTSDLIQAGTTEDTLAIGGPQYYAWYEILPAAETPIAGSCSTDTNCTVTPGDSMSVTISNQGVNTWLISMTDNGRWSFTKTLTYPSQELSAEWILEAPTLIVQTPIANVGVNTFDHNSFVANGATQTIASGNPTAIQLLFGLEATPSALDADGDGFNSCTFALSCSVPSS
jgi:hypothetical protein